jgi:N-terminal domain of anti-restriction factor ArdC
MKRDLYAEVSARIVAELEAGAAPWIKPWSASPGANPKRRAALYDINLTTGVSIEIFYADRTLETFGRFGAGWFWWPRRRGCSPDDSPSGPFATSYAAYRHAMNSVGAGTPKN